MSITESTDIFTLPKRWQAEFIGALCAKSLLRSIRNWGPRLHLRRQSAGLLAGLAVLKTILDDDLFSNADTMGSYFRGELAKLSEKHSIIGEIRGLGLMIASSWRRIKPSN